MPGIKTGIGVGVQVRIGANVNQPPAILRDGNTVAWYDSKDLSTITKDGSGFVSRWNDKLGSGHDLIQATGVSQPALGIDGLIFDGVNDYMQTQPFTFNQPEFAYLVLKQVTWKPEAVILDGLGSNLMVMTQWNPANNLLIYNDALINYWFNVIESFVIIRVLINGENSKIRVNDLTEATAPLSLKNMAGIGFGYSAGYSYANIIIKEAIFRNVSETALNEIVIYNFLKKKYNIV